MKSKFTISFDSESIVMAKELAAEKNTSASDFLEQYIRRTYSRANLNAKSKGAAHFNQLSTEASRLAKNPLSSRKSVKQLYTESLGSKYGIR